MAVGSEFGRFLVSGEFVAVFRWNRTNKRALLEAIEILQ